MCYDLNTLIPCSRRRHFSGNGNVDLHECDQKKQQGMNNHPQMVATGAN